MANVLYGVTADGTTFAAVAVLLSLVTVAAAYFPARRAMRLDPLMALQYESGALNSTQRGPKHTAVRLSRLRKSESAKMNARFTD